MLKLEYITPSAIKITTGRGFYDKFIFNESEMYDYDLNIYEYGRGDYKALVGQEMTMAKIFHKHKDKIVNFYVKASGL